MRAHAQSSEARGLGALSAFAPSDSFPRLIQKIGRDMRARKEGKILIVGSIAGFMPGTYQAVYNATKAFLDSFSFALRAEIADTGVTMTCLMPGATETEFIGRADMLDTKIGQGKTDDPADVAATGFKAMGDNDVVEHVSVGKRAPGCRIG